jgi:hypothetical protein
MENRVPDGAVVRERGDHNPNIGAALIQPTARLRKLPFLEPLVQTHLGGLMVICLDAYFQ